MAVTFQTSAFTETFKSQVRASHPSLSFSKNPFSWEDGKVR